MLCLHGFPESAVSWRYQIVPLAQAGFQVWAPDLRGYGGTTRPIGIDAYGIESLMDDSPDSLMPLRFNEPFWWGMIGVELSLGTTRCGTPIAWKPW